MKKILSIGKTTNTAFGHVFASLDNEDRKVSEVISYKVSLEEACKMAEKASMKNTYNCDLNKQILRYKRNLNK